ncbi:MAG: hypothetical protein K0S34_775 [Bacillales bacterium]|jgi:hypothetical protein|nr:hypothetical protein [Bacillales bacterium]
MKTNIREYAENFAVNIVRHENGRLVIEAFNEGGFNATYVDLFDVLECVDKIAKEE